MADGADGRDLAAAILDAGQGVAVNMDDSVKPPPKKRVRSERTRGDECFAINCTTYSNPITRAEGVSFHK